MFGATVTYPGTHVLGISEPFDYSSFVMSTFPQQHKTEPMVGFKILLRDTNKFCAPGDKINLIDTFAQQIFANQFCMLREGPITDPDTYYLISLPVPLSMLAQQIQNISAVYYFLYQHKFVAQFTPGGQPTQFTFGLGRQANTEICVSGRANIYQMHRVLSTMNLHPRYMAKLEHSSGLMMADVDYLSRTHALIRMKFKIPEATVLDDMSEIAHVMASVFASAS